MPTWRRSSRRLVARPPTSMPSAVMLPDWYVSNPLIQRSRVLLPEPERPMMATTSPLAMSSETPFSTSLAPKLFLTSRMLTSDIEPSFDFLRPPRQREAQAEIDQRDQRVDQERSEGRIVEHGAGLGQLDEANDRGERGALDDLYGEADGRRDRDARGLRQDDVAHLLDVAEREAGGRLPLALRYRFDAAAPDLGQERTGPECQRQRRRCPRRDLDAEQRDAEEEQKQLHQQRRALEELDIDLGEPFQRRDPRGTHEQERQAYDAAAGKRDQRQHDRPLRGDQ